MNGVIPLVGGIASRVGGAHGLPELRQIGPEIRKEHAAGLAGQIFEKLPVRFLSVFHVGFPLPWLTTLLVQLYSYNYILLFNKKQMLFDR